MESNVTFNPFADTGNKQLLEELCIYISNNTHNNIGWAELVAQSKLSHTQLQYLFNKHLQTTPMTYIRKQREQSNKVAYADKVKYNSLVANN
jgi:methylphosphotriester-DNA--protein-cysteine methyltransferase